MNVDSIIFVLNDIIETEKDVTSVLILHAYRLKIYMETLLLARVMAWFKHMFRNMGKS